MSNPEGPDADDLAIDSEVDKYLETGYEKRLAQKIRDDPAEILPYAIGTLFFIYHIWYARSFPIASDQHIIIHVGFALSFWASLKLLEVDRDGLLGKLLSVGYLLYMGTVVYVTYYFFTNFESLLFGAGVYSNEELVMGATIIALLMVALWDISWLIFAVTILGLVYSLFGPQMPGVLSHGGLSPERIISMNTVELSGIYGRLTRVAATWVAIFVMLAGLIEKYGGMNKLIKGITGLTDRYKYLKVSHVAVFGSMVFGSINGATTANAATTGSFTIPLMKENSYPPRLAAAIEAVASCGGQVLPPVMGASAFIMAELINPSYADIVIAATAPAFLFFIVVIMSIELYTHKESVDPMTSKAPSDDTDPWYIGVLKNYEYLAMAIMLVYWLVYVQSDPLLAGYYSIGTLIGLRIVRMLQTGLQSDEHTVAGQARTFSRESFEGFRRGTESAIAISIMVAALGTIVRAFIVTGFAQSLSRSLISIAGSSLVLMVLLSAVASVVFGMGMPTVAAYLLVALFVAPPLSEVVAINILAIHMFVFYFAIVSNITPPIAVAVVITQGIADSRFLETSLDALRIGFPMFVLPFLFIFNEQLLDPSLMLVPLVLILAVGFLALSVALIGYNGASLPVRLSFLAFGLVALFAQQLLLQAALASVILIGFTLLTPQVKEYYAATRGSL